MGRCAFLYLWINIFVLEKMLSGYVPVCAHPWRNSAGEASPLPKGLSWAGGAGGVGGVQEAHGSKTPGQREPVHAASQGEGDAESGGPPMHVG